MPKERFLDSLDIRLRLPAGRAVFPTYLLLSTRMLEFVIPNIINSSALTLAVSAAQVCCPAHIRYASVLPAAYDTQSQ